MTCRPRRRRRHSLCFLIAVPFYPCTEQFTHVKERFPIKTRFRYRNIEKRFDHFSTYPPHSAAYRTLMAHLKNKKSINSTFRGLNKS